MDEVVEFVPLLGFQRYRPYFDDAPAPTAKSNDSTTSTEIDTIQHVPEPTRILNINLGTSLSHDSSISSEGIDEPITFGSASRCQTSPLDDSTTSNENVRREKSKGRFFSSVGSWYQRRRVRVK